MTEGPRYPDILPVESPSIRQRLTASLTSIAGRMYSKIESQIQRIPPEAGLIVPMSMFGLWAAGRAAEIDMGMGARILCVVLLYDAGLLANWYFRVKAARAREYASFWDKD